MLFLLGLYHRVHAGSECCDLVGDRFLDKFVSCGVELPVSERDRALNCGLEEVFREFNLGCHEGTFL